jgi:hypothetical protein
LFRQEQLIEFDPGGGFTIPFEHIDAPDGGPDAFTLAFAGKPYQRVSSASTSISSPVFADVLDQQSVSFSDRSSSSRRPRPVPLRRHHVRVGALVDITSKIAVGGMLRPGFDLDEEGGPGHFVLAAEGGPNWQATP